jgi:signal transduction histidine kinase
MATRRYYSGLLRRMLLIGFVLPFLPLAVVSAIVIIQFGKASEETARSQLAESSHRILSVIEVQLAGATPRSTRNGRAPASHRREEGGHGSGTDAPLPSNASDEILNRVVREVLGPSSIVQAVVLDSHRKPLTAVPAKLQGLVDALASESPADPPALASQDVQETDDAEGNPYLYLLDRLHNGPWQVLFAAPERDLRSGYHTALRRTQLLVLATGLLLAANAAALSIRLARRIEAADRRKQKQTEQMMQTGKLAAIGQLAAGVAHEINNPVAIMAEEAGWIDDLLHDTETPPAEVRAEMLRAVGQIQRQGQRCKGIIQKLLFFARESDFLLEETNLAALVADAIAISLARRKRPDVEIETSIAEDLPPLLLLPANELEQVFINLIGNALDAMEDTGGTISISLALADERILVTVSDTGPGIPETDLPRIFDPFFTTKPIGQGTGLGLSISYGILKKIGGDIRVDNLPGQGATFRFTVPVPGRLPVPGTDPQRPAVDLEAEA